MASTPIAVARCVLPVPGPPMNTALCASCVNWPLCSLLSANSPEANSIDTREEIAATAKVGSNTVSAVERILATAPEPEILTAVCAGDVSINLVAQFDALPAADKQEALAAIAAHHKPAKEIMRGAVHKHRAKDEYEAT